MTRSASTDPSATATRARQRARDLEDFAYPTRSIVGPECDLVMKGGVTSGVVYPLAACELARTYRFRSIGGSSAGAIAATLVAAAEYGRDTGGFNRLAALPAEIGPILPSLFRAGPRTSTALAAIVAAADSGAGTMSRVRRVVRVLLRAQLGTFLAVVLLGSAIGVALTFALIGGPGDAVGGVRFAVLVAIFCALALVVGAGWAIIGEARATVAAMTEQGFGITVGSGGPGAHPATDDDPGFLTDWLADRIDQIAGLDRPLTVGDLAAHQIDLQVMTTNLTYGRPMTFPFSGRTFMFDPVELGRFFPPKVMAALQADRVHATDGDVALTTPAGRPLYHLPLASEIPVVVAARLSLSFPGLISAVPLWATDHSRADEADRAPVRCWFSDGGITSNFPIHFFDRLWPRRPTFALDLRGYSPDHPEADVYYAGVGPRQPRVKVITGIGSFIGSILDTMQYWADNAQATLPGYRDRVVEVHLHPDEGGFNLAMPSDVVAVLAEKGRQAAEALDGGFDFDQHRWIRYLTTMARIQGGVEDMGSVYDESQPGRTSTMLDVVADGSTFAHYRHSQRWVEAALDRTQTLLSFAATDDPDFDQDGPRPDSILRITPKF